MSAANAQTVGVVGFAMAEASLQLSLAAANPLIELLESDALDWAENCGGGGSKAVSVTDVDGSNSVTPGDQVAVSWISNCSSAELNGEASGVFDIDLIDVFVGASGEFYVSATVQFSGFEAGGDSGATATGSFDMNIVRNNALELVKLATSGAQRISITPGGTGSAEHATNIALRREQTRQPGASDRPYSLDVQLSIDSNILQGTTSCRSSRKLVSPNSSHEPLEGELQCLGAGGTDVIVNSDRDNQFSPIRLQVDAAGNGVYADVARPSGASWTWIDFVEGGLFTARVGVVHTGPLPERPIVTPTSVTLPINDIVYGSTVDRLYATTNDGIVELDPDTLAVLRSLDVAGRPGTVGISDDSTTAWMALDDLNQVQEVDLTTMTAGIAFDLGDTWIGSGPREAHRIRVAPGTTDLVVISTEHASEMLAFKAGVLLPGVVDDRQTQFSPPDAFVFRSASDIVAADTGSTAYSVFQIKLDPVLGLELLSDVRGLASFASHRLKLGSDFVFTSRGVVFDEVSQQIVTDLKQDGYFYFDLDVDAVTNTVVAMSSSTQIRVDVFDEVTLSLIGSYRLPPNLPSTGLGPIVLTASSLVIRHGNELRRIDRGELGANFDPAACVRVDLSGVIVAGRYVSLDCGVTSVVHDSARGQIYAGVSSSRAEGNSVAVIDESDFNVQAYIPVGASPGPMALSADASTLYVAINNANRYVEIDLAAGAVTREVSLGLDITTPYVANSLASAQGIDGDLVVSMNNDVALFGGGAQVGVLANPHAKYSRLHVAPGGAAAFGQTGDDLDEFNISSSGVAEVQTHSSALYSQWSAARGSTIFGAGGTFFDMASGATTAGCSGPTIPLNPWVRVGVEQDSEHVYYAWIAQAGAAPYEYLYIVACDALSLEKSAAAEMVIFRVAPGTVIDVLAVGAGKLAILTTNRLIVVDGPVPNTSP